MNSITKNHEIVHIIAKLEKGGAEKLIFLLCNLLRKNHINFRILTLIEIGSFAKEFKRAGIHVDLIDISTLNPLNRLYKIYKYLKIYKPDVIHTHLFHGDVYGLIAAYLAHVKKRVSTLHNMIEIKSKKKSFILILAYLFSTDLVMVSNSVRKFWSLSLVGCKKKMRVIYNSSGFSHNSAYNIRSLPIKSNIQLLCLGSIHPIKGHIYLINSMRLIKNCSLSFQLNIYGRDRDGYSDFLQSKIKEFDLTEFVALKGETDDPELVISTHDIFIMPSLSEGFGMAIVEAMSIGLPIIASKIPAHEELLSEGKYGLLIDIKNEADVCKTILDLAQDSQLYEQYSQASLKRSMDFTVGKMIANYSNLYTE